MNFFLSLVRAEMRYSLQCVREPQKLLDVFLTNQVRGYFYEMVRPAVFLPLASMVGLFALPTMAMNSLIGAFWPSMINITNHYSLIATVCLFVGLAEAIGWIGRYSRWFQFKQTNLLFRNCMLGNSGDGHRRKRHGQLW